MYDIEIYDKNADIQIKVHLSYLLTISNISI